MATQVINTLDQFNINMCNEVLQGEFVRCIFDLEQALYQEQLGEKIDIDFEDNKDTIQLLKNAKGSIIKELDSVITMNRSGQVLIDSPSNNPYMCQ
jgi:myosin heavy subunit